MILRSAYFGLSVRRCFGGRRVAQVCGGRPTAGALSPSSAVLGRGAAPAGLTVRAQLVRPKPEPKVTAWVTATDENLLYLSVLTLGEIRKGIALLKDASRRVALEAWLDSHLALRFEGRFLPIDQEVADRWGRLAALAGAKSPLPVIDGLLAATALAPQPHSGHT